METLVIWHVTDGRAGHVNQSLGLIDALERRRPCQIHTFRAVNTRTALRWALARRFPPGADRPDPQLLIGAGRRTQPTLLAARRARGGRTVVLMRPAWPYAWFDLCLVPDHDPAPARSNVVRTRGAINRMLPARDRDPDRGLILIGGPSNHYGWDETALLKQLKTLLQYSTSVHWTIADSPRTPVSTGEKLAQLRGARYQPYRDAPPDWLRRTLPGAGTVWVSEDSVSMIHEALTAGAVTGVLPVPRRKNADRIGRGVDSLIEQGYVYDFNDWLHGDFRPPVVEPLREADRCADLLLRRLLPEGPT